VKRIVRCLAVILATCSLILTTNATPAAAGPNTVSIFVDCVYERPNGSWVVLFGYNSPGTATLLVPIGPDNRLNGNSGGTGQPVTTFVPGRHSPAFFVDMPPGTANVVWQLNTDGSRRTATGGKNFATKCSTDPVPLIGSSPTGLVAFSVTALLVCFYLLRQRRHAAPEVSS
jgi:hypothetical protein